jgi:hypothetical protein
MTRSPKPDTLYRKLTNKVANIFKRRQTETEPDRKGFRPHRLTQTERYTTKNAPHQNKMRAKRRTKAKGVVRKNAARRRRHLIKVKNRH